MTDKQPETLRLAAWLESFYPNTSTQAKAAAELRRLHSLSGELSEKLMISGTELAGVKAQRDELLEALKDAMSLIEALMPGVLHIPLQDYAALNNTPLKARAAIAKAGGAALDAPQPPVVKQTLLPDFDDPKVQAVYEILCDTDCTGKPRDEHWEGWQARRIVAALEQQVADHQHKLIAISDELAAGAIAALTSYCNTGEIDGADDLLAELLFERDHPPAVERPNIDPCKDGSCNCCWTDKPQLQGEQEPLTEDEMRDIAADYFSADWAQEKAIMLMRDHGIGSKA